MSHSRRLRHSPGPTILASAAATALATMLATMLAIAPPLHAQDSGQDRGRTADLEYDGTPEQRYGDWVRRLDFRPQEYAFRRSNMIRLLRESGGGIMLIPSSDGRTHGTTFRQLEDFWYYSGLEVPNSMLVLDADRDVALLFLPGTDYRFENPGRRNDFPGRPLLEDYHLRSIAGMQEYRDMAELGDYLRGRIAEGTVLRVNGGSSGPLADPEVPMFGALDPIQSMIVRLRDDYPAAHMTNAFDDVARGRMVKSRSELQRMQIAADATAQAILSAASHIRPGVDERTLQGEFESTCRALGSQTIPFTPIVKAGPNSLWPWRVLAAHYDRRNRPIESDELVILDVGCEIDGYISDVGRTFPVDGTFSDIQREKLLVSTRAADAIIAAIRPGVTLRELTEIAYEAIPDDEEKYMQTPSYFGHHIGLNSGDPALMDVPLEPGMVFTVEPWYYNHDLEIAVFVEDVVVVTEDGVAVLTRGLARTPEELEAVVR
jgi:Xaa-Pro aminopeptidase